MNSFRKDLRSLTRKHGWRIELTRGGHIRLSRPGAHPVICSATPSCRRAIHHVEAALRRAEREEGRA